jgi:hypothetical protein
MDTERLIVQAGPDRFATNDEIRAALSFLPDFFLECEKGSIWEVESDMGGWVLIRTEEDDQESMILFEKLDATLN